MDGIEALYEHFHFTADPGQNPIRVDKFLVDRLMRSSRSRVQRAADAGMILVNGKAVASNFKVRAGDTVQVMMDRPRHSSEIVPEDIPLSIVYEDDDLLVVDKPAGMVVHPGHGNYSGTLVNALAAHFLHEGLTIDLGGHDDEDEEEGEPPVGSYQQRMGLVHRIDKETSGLLVVAKNEEAGASLCRQFLAKTTRRLYNALVWGAMEHDEGVIEGNIGRSHRDRTRMDFFPAGSTEGKTAITHYRTLERLGYVSLTECRLETGRTHQIRVHMQHIGHTLFNDKTYGGDQVLRGTTFPQYTQFVHRCFEACPRQALHARTLGFRHPRTGEEMDFESPLPDDMQRLLSLWHTYIAQREKNA